MDPEPLNLIQDAIEKGLTSRIWLVMLLGLICAGAGAFLGSYLKKMGEQRAIKEKFDEVLQQIAAQTEVTQAIKADFAKDISSFTADLSTDLETLKACLQEDLSYKIEVLLPRLDAYKTLWELTYIVRPTRKDRIKDEEKAKLEEDLTSWYYKNGQGIFLSLEAGRLWRSARRSLSSDSDEEIKEAFSALKTQLKTEIKVYGELDAVTELGT